MVDVTLTQKGEAETQEYRVFFSEKGKDISPWHDIPLKVSNRERGQQIVQVEAVENAVQLLQQ